MTGKEVIETLKELVYKGDNVQKICDYVIL